MGCHILLLGLLASCDAFTSLGEGVRGPVYGTFEEHARQAWLENGDPNITKSFRVLDEDDANLYLRETVSQIAFLLEHKDINMEEAFYVLTRQPIVNAILLAEIEQHLPVECTLADFETADLGPDPNSNCSVKNIVVPDSVLDSWLRKSQSPDLASDYDESYMAETLDQLVFLTEAGDINASMAFFTLLQMPWVKPMLIQDMEGFMPEGCLMTDFDTGTVCIDEDEDETKEHMRHKRGVFSVIRTGLQRLIGVGTNVVRSGGRAIRRTLNKHGIGRGGGANGYFHIPRTGSLERYSPGAGWTTSMFARGGGNVGSHAALKSRVWQGIKNGVKAIGGGILVGTGMVIMDQATKAIVGPEESLLLEKEALFNQTEMYQEAAFEMLSLIENKTIAGFNQFGGWVRGELERLENNTHLQDIVVRDESADAMLAVYAQIQQSYPLLSKNLTEIMDRLYTALPKPDETLDFLQPPPTEISKSSSISPAGLFALLFGCACTLCGLALLTRAAVGLVKARRHRTFDVVPE